MANPCLNPQPSSRIGREDGMFCRPRWRSAWRSPATRRSEAADRNANAACVDRADSGLNHPPRVMARMSAASPTPQTVASGRVASTIPTRTGQVLRPGTGS